MTRYRLCILCALLSALAAWLVLGPSSASAQDKPVSFINEVAPILKENCFACHDAKQVAAGGYDGEVRVWNVADGAVVKAFNASPGYVTPVPEPKKK